MKKRLASLLLCAALMLSCVPGAGAFSDITDGETAVAAAALQGLGVVSGTPDGSFRPDDTLTRAQVCVMAVNMMGLSDQVSAYARKTLFTDVPSGSWYNGYVNLAYSQGIINGYGNGKFGPDDLVTYGQLVTILLRMLGYTSSDIGSFWPGDYTACAERLGLSEGLSLDDFAAVTRGEGALLFYRTLKANVRGSDRTYYSSIGGLSSSAEAILLDTDASYGGSDGLLAAYDLKSGLVYYHQNRTQSAALTGSLGQLLFDAAGKVMGFIPDSDSYEDLTISSATAAAVKDTSGRSLRVSADVTVIAGGESYTYHNGGYLRLNEKAGRSVRVFYGGDGEILCLYLAGGTADASRAAVAGTSDPLSEFEEALDLSGKTYAITKNGAAAEAGSLAKYDVAYYDAASSTLRVSDYRVEGVLTAASPSLTAAKTVTLAGAELAVLEGAWDTLGEFELGERVTVLLTDDGKVAAAYRPSRVGADMVGVLDTQGRSVTLVGSGVTLTAAEVEYKDGLPGTLVSVEAEEDELVCTSFERTGKALNIPARTLGSYTLAPSCAIYEWAGSGYVYDLAGNQGAASLSLDSIGWTEELSASYIGGYHLNSAGEVDVLLLEDVTGNTYRYGQIATQADGIGTDRDSTNDAATVTNAGGTGEKYLSTVKVADGTYVGAAVGKGLKDYAKLAKVVTLAAHTGARGEDFERKDGVWYVTLDGESWPISDDIQVHLTAADTWLSGEDGLMAALADGYTLTLYTDRDAAAGGQVRLVKAK